MTKQSKHITREQRLIASIREWTGERLIGDDCAVLPGGTLVTADTLVEGTHFRLPQTSFEDLGWKSVAVNLSDIAAMGGRPRFLIVSLTMPDDLSNHCVEKLYVSMVECARSFRARIVGGDLTRGDSVVISITAMGDQHESGCMMRSGAQVGDVVFVTGDFGASAAGLWVVERGVSGYKRCRQAYFRPQPRLSESWQIVSATGGRGALMDASDGLADALSQISQASQVAIEITEDLIPIHEDTRLVAARAGRSYLDWALYGGEDYELVGTMDPSAARQLAGQGLRIIGEVKEGSEVTVKGRAGSFTVDLSRSYQHWS